MGKRKNSAPATGAAKAVWPAANPKSRGDRLFAPCILDYGHVSSMGETGLALMAMSTAERHEFIESFREPETEDQKNVARLVRTASSEIDAHLLIERIRAFRDRPSDRTGVVSKHPRSRL